MSFCEGNSHSSNAYGCLFCRVGCEDIVIREIVKDETSISAISPVKIRFIRGINRSEKVILFPGYVFFSAPSNYDISSLIHNKYVYRALTYGDHGWQLVGGDREIAEALFQAQGVIGFSKAYYENDRIRIVEGFLKKYEGNILKVNHRMKTAQVLLKFNQIDLKVWLGFEVIEPIYH